MSPPRVESPAMLFVIRYLLARLIFHPLEGLTWSLWRKLLRQERWWRITIGAWPKAVLLTMQSLWQSFFARRVERRFGAAIRAAEVRAPVFILGHYRSGTTHLHELMSLDPRFASPTRFQAYHPRSFLATERRFGPINDLFMLPRRVQEDEIALMNLTAMSPYLEWVFPEGEDYTRYLDFRTDPDDARIWQDALRWYLQALTVRYRKPILLKSPPHTARVALIRAVFPDAKFVHIRRDPFAVFVSTVRLLKDIDPVFRLGVRSGPISEWRILQTYEEMYDQYLADVPTVPPGQLTEIAYEDLETDPIGQLERIYRDLKIDGFEAVRPTFESYLASIADYQKNRHPRLDPATKARIVERWGRFFRHWGYPIGDQDPQQAS